MKENMHHGLLSRLKLQYPGELGNATRLNRQTDGDVLIKTGARLEPDMLMEFLTYEVCSDYALANDSRELLLPCLLV